MIDQERLWASLMEMAVIGRTARGGVCRRALSDEDKVSRDLFVSWSEAAGCQVRIDRVGNIFARRPGRDGNASPVVTGSHLDTQPLGGRFDGAYGVLAGLEVVRALNDADIETRAPIDIVNWTDEEGCRFTTRTMGSMAFAGMIDEAAILDAIDEDGVSFADELSRIGYAGSGSVLGHPVKALIEIHIEQGPLLEQAGISIGAVLGAQARRIFQVTVTGEEGHAGTLPMDQRKDAFLGAARMTDAVNAVAFCHQPVPVITVGHVRVRPNSRNTIPGETIFTIDSRHPDDDLLDRVSGEIQVACRAIADDMGLNVDVDQVSNAKAVGFDAHCVEAVRRAAAGRGIACMDVFSGAGHDACNVARIALAGMIFVPCKDGISHNELESATPEDVTDGARVLHDVVLEFAEAV